MVYSSENGSYGGMITTPDNTVLMVQNPDSGFKVDNMGVARQSKDGRRWDYGGLLLTARVNQNTVVGFQCGVGKINRIGKNGYGVYIVYHDLRSANYTVTASIWLSDFASDVISIGNITSTSFTVRMTNNSYQPVEQPFMFQMFGY
ncbi:MAG: hypothetical protein RR522_01425 [Alistipes sp.]